MSMTTISTLSNFLTRPIGYTLSRSKKEIKEWAKDENPGLVKALPGSSILSVVGTLIGVVTAFFGFKNDQKLLKWIGTPLTILSALTGAMFLKLTKDNINEVRQDKKNSENHTNTMVMDKLEEISKIKVEKEKNGLRYKFLKTVFKSNNVNALEVIHSVKNSKENGILCDEASKLLELLTIQENNEKGLVNLLRDKSSHENIRSYVLSRLYSDSLFGVNYPFLDGKTSIIDILAKESKDEKNTLSLREEFLAKLNDYSSTKTKETVSDGISYSYDFEGAVESVTKIKDRNISDDERFSSLRSLIYYFGKDFYIKELKTTPLNVLIEELRDKNNSLVLREKILDKLQDTDFKALFNVSLDLVKDPSDNLELRKTAVGYLSWKCGTSDTLNELFKVSLGENDPLKEALIQGLVFKMQDRKNNLETCVQMLVDYETHVVNGDINFNELTVLSRDLDLKDLRAKIKKLPREITHQVLLNLINEMK